jgi:hypothetical protein
MPGKSNSILKDLGVSIAPKGPNILARGTAPGFR